MLSFPRVVANRKGGEDEERRERRRVSPRKSAGERSGYEEDWKYSGSGMTERDEHAHLKG